MSVRFLRFFLSISSEPIVRTCENHSQFSHFTTFTPIFWTQKMWTELVQAQIFPRIRWVFQVGGALCLFRAHHFWSSHELSTCCSLNAGLLEGCWQPRIHQMSAVKVRSPSFACSFLLLRGVSTWLFLSLFDFFHFFLLYLFWEPWGSVGRWSGLGWNHQIKVDEELPPPMERSRVETVQSFARVYCECLGRPCYTEMTDVMRTTRGTKVEQNFDVRTFVKVRPFLRVERRLHMLHELHSFGDLQVLCWSFVLLCPSTAMPLQM